jgi:hypothetical protein
VVWSEILAGFFGNHTNNYLKRGRIRIMSKTIRDTHVTGMKGVNLFEQYCLQHSPVIIFRETLKSDFGIDAEIEMTEFNDERKVEPTGEIIKVQIKTDGTGHSYIKNEGQTQFDYYASEDDIEYWSKYKSHGLEVVLVIIDALNQKIYCKKVFDTDLGIAKTAQRKKKSFPIIFDKTSNLLEFGKNDFRERFSDTFRSRVNYGITETLVSNMLKFQKTPKLIFRYKSKFKDKRAIIKFIKESPDLIQFKDCPYFIGYGSFVFTFNTLGKEFSVFVEQVLEDGISATISYNEVIGDIVLRNHYIELINEYIKEKLRTKGLHYHPKYRRYYFSFNPEKDTVPVVVEAFTRVRREKTEKKVVTWHEYGTKYKFYRHLAFNLHFHFIENELYVAFAHKYFFTEDGRKTLAPKEITKFTNYLTARDYNDKYYDWLNFWWTYLSKDSDTWDIFDYANVVIKIQSFYSEEVSFGIPLENKIEKPRLRSRIKKLPYQNTNLLFTDED